MKCLPQNKISTAQGIILHDWHAEILAIRSFNCFILEECLALVSSPEIGSDFVRLRTPDEMTEHYFQPFALKDDIELHMYCSEAPCNPPDLKRRHTTDCILGGDASMELTMAAQEDATPWESTALPLGEAEGNQPTLHGRSYFSALGTVRRKPSRPDAPPTLSKSCSDKLSLAQCKSLLSSVSSLLVSPSSLYLKTLTLPASQHSSTACNRAFSASGRMSPVKNKDWNGGYAFKPFEIQTTSHEFKYSRRQSLLEGEKLVASNIAASWISSRTPTQTEVLIGGILQGRKKFDLLGASRASRRSIWRLALEISALVAVPQIYQALNANTYQEVVRSDYLEPRMQAKNETRKKALKNWVVNKGDEEWGRVDAKIEWP